jgi:hypothetical protein
VFFVVSAFVEYAPDLYKFAKTDRFQTVYKSGQNKKSKQPYYTNRLTKPVRFLSELAEKTTKAVFERKLVVGGRCFARAESLAI